MNEPFPAGFESGGAIWCGSRSGNASEQRAGRARLAAIGDLHVRVRAPVALEADLLRLGSRVDVLVVTGDITNGGRMREVERAAAMFRQLNVPIIAVLGNHDLRNLRRVAFRKVLDRAGVTVLDGAAMVLTTASGVRLGFAGVGGCGGGFWPVEGPRALHSRAFKALALRTHREVRRLDSALSQLDADFRIAVTHFAPTATTLGAEPLLKYWMLGNCELGRVVDRHAVDLVLHGHAHLGNPLGCTVGGTPVRNVAYSVNRGLVVHEFSRDQGRSIREPSDWLTAGPGA